MPSVIARFFSPTSSTNPELMAFVLFGKQRVERGGYARILKLGDYPKNFTNFLEMRCLATRGPHSSVATIGWNYRYFLFTQGTVWQVTSCPAPSKCSLHLTFSTHRSYPLPQTPFPNTTSVVVSSYSECVRRASGASGMTLRKAPTGPVSSHLNHRIPLPSLHHMGLYQQVCIERRNIAHFVTRRL